MKHKINQTIALYGKSESAQWPGALAVDGKAEWLQLGAMANADRQTWFVIGLGYFGRGHSITEAAANCLKAGCSRSDKVSVMLVVGDDNAAFLSVFQIEFQQGATLLFIGSFKSLAHLLAVKQPKQ